MSDIYLQITETPTVVTLSAPVVSGALASTVTVANTVTVALDANSLSALEQVTVTVGAAVSVSNFPSTQTISGTVTANVLGFDDQSGLYEPIPVGLATNGFAPNEYAVKALIGTEAGGLSSANPLPISGTVTANLSSVPTHGVTIANTSVTVNGTFYQATQPVSLVSVPTHGVTIAAGTAQIGSVTASISGTVPVSGTFYQATQPVSIASLPSLAAGSAQIGSVTASISGTPTVTMGSISGTVTANVVSTTVTVSALPSGALTTRFGSVTTANTAQLTAAVTNSARRYLLCQNLDPSVTVTIGIGFTPTTTQGIQLAAGGGIIMDSFVSTGAVWWLSSSAGSNFSILEG